MITRVEQIGDCTIALGDCLEILPTLGKFDVIVSDPPYGMNYNTDSKRFSRKRSKAMKAARSKRRARLPSGSS